MRYYSNKLKIIVYFIIISIGISINAAISISNGILSPSINPLLLIVTGMILGVFSILTILKKKNIYKAGAFVIFLLEFSLIASTLYAGSTLGLFVGNFTLGMSISSSVILCPIITHYLRGPVTFLGIFPHVLIAYFTGLISLNILLQIPENILHSTSFFLVSLFFFLCGFFTVFSAWKRRFVLLK